MVSIEKRGNLATKPKCLIQYDHQMRGVDLKDHKLQPYLVGRKVCMKWYLKMFRRLLNTPVHNVLIIHSKNEDIKILNDFPFRFELIK